jgi:hypothetical protein
MYGCKLVTAVFVVVLFPTVVVAVDDTEVDAVIPVVVVSATAGPETALAVFACGIGGVKKFIGPPNI